MKKWSGMNKGQKRARGEDARGESSEVKQEVQDGWGGFGAG